MTPLGNLYLRINVQGGTHAWVLMYHAHTERRFQWNNTYTMIALANNSIILSQSIL